MSQTSLIIDIYIIGERLFFAGPCYIISSFKI